MGLCCSCGKSRSLHDKTTSEMRLTHSMKRMKTKRLVGVAQIALDAAARAREEFPKADRDKNGTLSFAEVKSLLFKLNAYIPKKQLKQIFEEVDVNKDGQLNLEEFQQLFSKADHRETMHKLYREADQLINGYISAQNLYEFFLATAPADGPSGWTPPSVEECSKLIAQYLKGKGKRDSRLPAMKFPEFERFLSDPEQNHICSPQRVFSVYQDMTRPLSHYYISSSHNSYLLGNQTNGISSPDAIQRALELGVRVIELDVWDGSSEPIVNHGHTFCKPTTFKLCIEAVGRYAFTASRYPVILTIENHCSKTFQEKMAKILSGVLGDKLFRFQSPNEEREKLFRGPDEWVSPSQLLGRIVVRDKPKRLHVKKENKDDVVTRQTALAAEQKEPRTNKVTFDETSEDASKLHLSVPSGSSPRAAVTGEKVRKKGLLKALLKNGKSTGTLTSSGDESSGRSLGMSISIDTSSKTLDKGLEKKSPPSSPRNLVIKTVDDQQKMFDDGRSVRGDDVDEDDEDDDEFIDDTVEQEGLGDVVAAKLDQKKKDFQLSLNGSIRFAAGKLGFGLNEDEFNKKLPEWLQEPPTEKPTNSVPHLLEIVYIKNVKLKFIEDRIKRPSMKSTIEKSARNLKPEDFKTIHFTYPEWRSSSSVSEGKMLKLVRPGPRVAALTTYSNHHLIRCFPAGSRVESTNYDPCPAWNAGIQIVALNYQTNGKPIWLNQGKFADNGACGWVLKPAAMLNARSCGRDTPEEESPEEEDKEYWDLIPKESDPRGDRLVITIVSGHHLPKPFGTNEARSEIIDPFVEVHINGFGPDETICKTKWVDDNGFNPEFNETFSITMRKPEINTVLFVVKDKDQFGEDFVAQNAFPVNLLRPGYRTVPLRRADSTPIPDAFLFVHVKWERGAVPATL